MLSTHQSKSRVDDPLGFASGSTAWVNAARSALEIRIGKDDDPPSLIVRKANHAKPGLEIPLEWRDAVLIASETGDAASWIEERQFDRMIFAEIDRAWERGTPLSLYRQAKGRFLPQLLASKSRLKARVLEYFRQVERTGKELVITDHGKPVLKIVPYSEDASEALRLLRNSVIKYEDPTEPVGLEDWESLG